MALATTLLASCASVDGTAITDNKCGLFDDPKTPALDFKAVSDVLERRCGTLDCHGQTARPLRIYGQLGLRSQDPKDLKGLSDDDKKKIFSGVDALPTTAAEQLDNYQSACSLEPELTALVVTGAAQPETLTLVRKPRLLEKHKGGVLWNQGDVGDTCIINWLTGQPFDTPCTAELQHP
jgi:hypothetical protein